VNISWHQIVAECGNYKSGFVAVFRKYEGVTTDEVTAQGHVVKVTKGSFADHMGIPRNTFQGWVRRAEDTEFVSSNARQARTAASHASVAKNMARSKPSDLVDAIQAAGVGAEDQVYHELRQRRAGVDTSKAGRKASAAAADVMVQPFRSMLRKIEADTILPYLAALKDTIEEGIADGTLTEHKLDAIRQDLLALADLCEAGKVFVR
jgi:hypothetical protein